MGDPIAINPELTIKALRPLAPWRPEQTKPLVTQIAQLRPFLDTPLVWAMWVAANKDLKSAKGLKTLLVLTDGDDTELEKNKPQYNPGGLPIKDFILQGFKPLGITVNMVFFTRDRQKGRNRQSQGSLQPGPRTTGATR